MSIPSSFVDWIAARPELAAEMVSLHHESTLPGYSEYRRGILTRMQHLSGAIADGSPTMAAARAEAARMLGEALPEQPRITELRVDGEALMAEVAVILDGQPRSQSFVVDVETLMAIVVEDLRDEQ